MTRLSIVGVDPGKACGICFLDYQDTKLIASARLQVNSGSVLYVMETLLLRAYNDPDAVPKRFAGIEPFITGNSAGTKGDPAEETRQLAFAFGELLQVYGYYVQRRKAADVKPWASDERLKAAGIYDEHTGMRHANDASRQALYAAVHDAYRPDPLR